MVVLTISDTVTGPRYDAETEQLEYDPAARQRVQETAEVVDAVLRRRGLVPLYQDDKTNTERPATVDEIATTTVIVIRPSRTPDDQVRNSID